MTDPRFPVLTQKQISTLKGFGSVISFDKETTIVKIGDKVYDFYVVLNGEICVKDPLNENLVIVTHGINEFTGDNSMLSNRSIPFNAYASKGTTLLQIKRDILKDIISKHSDISDVLLGAFIQRQETMLREFSGGIKVIGSENSKNTYGLRDFMEKNHIWHTFLNTDVSEEAQQLLENFNLDSDDLPIILNITGELFKKPTISELAKLTGVLTEFGNEIYSKELAYGQPQLKPVFFEIEASEGLTVVTIDGNAPGGQAGKSSKIENYLGFPTGISGNDLANKGLRVIVAGLDMDFKGNPFGPMPALMATAEYVTKVHAICTRTGNLAHYSFRKSANDKLVMLGETEELIKLKRCIKNLH